MRAWGAKFWFKAWILPNLAHILKEHAKNTPLFWPLTPPSGRLVSIKGSFQARCWDYSRFLHWHCEWLPWREAKTFSGIVFHKSVDWLSREMLVLFCVFCFVLHRSVIGASWITMIVISLGLRQDEQRIIQKLKNTAFQPARGPWVATPIDDTNIILKSVGWCIGTTVGQLLLGWGWESMLTEGTGHFVGVFSFLIVENKSLCWTTTSTH